MSTGNRKRRKKAGLLPQAREKCLARNRFGEPCKNWPIEGATVCRAHGGAAPQVRRKAQERIAMAQDDAASTLVRFMGDDKVPYSERRRCAEFLLTYENRNEVNMTIAKWEGVLDGILVDSDDDDIIDAEVVEDQRAISSAGDADGLKPFVDDHPTTSRGNRLRGR